MDGVPDRERAFYDKRHSIARPVEISEALEIPGFDTLKGMRIVICGCGTGAAAVLAARAGAEVYAFDISPVAIEKTLDLASANGVSVTAQVMDFHHLEYPNDFFDIAWGSSILHHIDCERAGRELYRVLKPGGIARFWENSDANPINRWIRRKVFGIPGGYQKRRFLVFKRIGSTDEYPLTAEELDALKRTFHGDIMVKHTQFVFLELIGRHAWRGNKRLRSFLARTDSLIARVLPGVMKYSFHQTVWLRKSTRQGSISDDLRY